LSDVPQRVQVVPEAGCVLVQLQDEAARASAARWLGEAGYEVVVADDEERACGLIESRLDLDVVVADAPTASPADRNVVTVARQGPPGLCVILVGPEDVYLVTQAMSHAVIAGYVSPPLTQVDLLGHVFGALQRARRDLRTADQRRTVSEEVHFEGIVGTTPRMKEVMDILRKAAPTDAPIVITGETGSGKELLAQAVHASSARRNGPFVALHLHATPAGLVESELFGHKKGAFTGATADRVGKLEAADGGTLFLDELGDIPLETQVKLLRVLETQQFEPVGSNKSVHSDFRLITATNQDIEGMIAEKAFREELWYRLKVIRVELPALRERRGDVPVLVERFTAEWAARYGKTIEGVDPEVVSVLQRQPWPGNIRDLRNVLQFMVVMAEGPRLTLRDLPRDLRGEDLSDAGVSAGGSLAGRAMNDIEREAIKATLELTGGNRKATADMLQIGERTLYRKIEKYGL
jgi:two-component system response regulator HydG